MFIRQKLVKNQPYAYLVKNKWSKGEGARQKMSKYLGRIHSIPSTVEVSWDSYSKERGLLVEEMNPKDILFMLLRVELLKLGFIESKRNINILRQKDFLIDIEKMKVRRNGSETVIKLNEDFLCKFTLKRLFSFKFQGDEREVGLEFAKVIVGAGIICPGDLFLMLFRKIFSDGGVSRVSSF